MNNLNRFHFYVMLILSVNFVFGQDFSEVNQEVKPLGTMPKDKAPQIYIGTTFLITVSGLLIAYDEAKKGSKKPAPLYFQWYVETPRLGGFLGYKGSFFQLPATVSKFRRVISTEFFYKHFTNSEENLKGWFLQYSAVVKRLQSTLESGEEPFPIESHFGWSGGAMIYLGYEDKSHKNFWWGADLGVGGAYSSELDQSGIPYNCPSVEKNCHYVLVSPNVKVGMSF